MLSQKLEKCYSADAARYRTLESGMKSEIAAGAQMREGTVSLAVVWLTRGLMFILEMLRLFTQRTKAPPPPPPSQHTHLARPQLSRALGTGARLSSSYSHSSSSNGGSQDAGPAPDAKLFARSFQHSQRQTSVQCDASVQLDDANPDELVEIASEAYEKTLRKHHNWIVRGLVRVCNPYFEDLLRSLAIGIPFFYTLTIGYLSQLSYTSV